MTSRSSLPVVTLVRHGATEWSRCGKHTGLTDLPLLAEGEEDAIRLAPILAPDKFDLVATSPLVRARETCRLAGFGDVARIDPDLTEWDYGDYEGRTTAEIRADRPGWQLFRDGCPGGEQAADVAARADRVIATLRRSGGNALLFSSGHLLRVLAARWLGLAPQAGALFTLGTASISQLGYDHDRTEPAIRRWNLTAA